MGWNHWVVIIAVGCSSSNPAPTPARATSTTPAASVVQEPVRFASCDAPKPKTAERDREELLRSPPKGLPGGMFGLAGLEVRDEPTKGSTCQAARSTLDAANALILKGTAGAPKPSTRAAWDRRSEPARWKRVAQRFGLDDRHRATLAKDGFVIAAASTFNTYISAYHEVFQSQLPIYVSIDSVLHAIFASHAAVVGDVETDVLMPRVAKLLKAMHCWLPAGAKNWPATVARDADLYLTVARSLLERDPVDSLVGNNKAVAALLAQIKEAKGLFPIELFGRSRYVDFSAYQPAGRYRNGDGSRYYQAMVWLSRIELNLVSRSSRSSTIDADPRETPREAALALALLDAAKNAGVLADITAVDEAWGVLAGAREDISFAQLDELRSKGKLDRISLAAQPALAHVIGDQFKRSIPLQAHPDGLTDLPVITAMFGSRVAPDASALTPIIQPSVPHRIAVGAADLGFVLGHDRAKAHLASELAAYPALDGKLGAARAKLDARLGGDDLYSAWLRAIRALAKPTPGSIPSFMKSDGYADLRLASAVTAYGQLRHSYQLMTGMSYLGSGCEIPDGWVEPAAEVYDALIAYAERGKSVLAKLDPSDQTKAAAYFTQLGTTLRVLRGIVATELADRPLTETQKRWLSMVVEIVVDNSGSGKPPTYAGWYFDLFRDFEDATSGAKFVAPYAFNATHIEYIGAQAPQMGVFVIDVGGAPRVAVGPIARPFETEAPHADGRLDEDNLDATKLREPWSTSYTVAGGAAPLLDIEQDYESNSLTFIATAETEIGPVTISLLDHHRVPLMAVTQTVKPGKTKFQFRESVRKRAEILHLKVGAFHAWLESSDESGGFAFRGLKPEDP